MRVESASSSQTPTNAPEDQLSSRAGTRTPQAQLQLEHQPRNLSSRGDATQSMKTTTHNSAINNQTHNTSSLHSQQRANRVNESHNANYQRPEAVLNGGGITGNSRPTTADSGSSSRPASSSSIVPDRKSSFLPDIDPKGRMSTQRPSSGALDISDTFPKTPNTQKPLLAKTVWSSFSEQDTSLAQSHDSEIRSTNSTPVPRPPSSGRKSKNKKHRP